MKYGQLQPGDVCKFQHPTNGRTEERPVDKITKDAVYIWGIYAANPEHEITDAYDTIERNGETIWKREA